MDEPINLSLFDARAYPHSSPVVDPSKPRDGWERDAVAVFFRGKSNADIVPEALEEFPYDFSTCHHLLTGEAFAFFLPGLMRLVLAHQEIDQIGRLGDSLVNTLLRMAKGEMGYRLHPIFERYTQRQLAVIATFLVEVARLDSYPMPEEHSAVEALRLFWGQFLTDAHPTHREVIK